jgi:hypothetical protein
MTVLPEIAEMSVGQLAALASTHLAAADHHIDQLQAQLLQIRVRIDLALERRYGEQARDTLRDAGREFGAGCIYDGPVRVQFEQSQEISWDQKQLSDIAQRIVAAGEVVESYLDVQLSVPEVRFRNWPPALQEQFVGARAVKPGKRVFTLSIDGRDA